MLRGRYGMGWMLVGWAVVAGLVALAIISVWAFYQWIS